MSTDDEHGSSGLEAHATLDADDGVAHMTVATDGVAGAYLLDLLYGLYLIVELLSVDGADFSLLEANLELFRTFLCRMLQVSAFGQTLFRVEYLAAADAGTPQTDVVAVLELGEVSEVAVLVEVIHFLLT